MIHPSNAITLHEAAHILRCSISTVRRHIIAGRLESSGPSGEQRQLSRDQVEQLACQLYDWRRQRRDPDSYRVTSAATAPSSACTGHGSTSSALLADYLS